MGGELDFLQSKVIPNYDVRIAKYRQRAALGFLLENCAVHHGKYYQRRWSKAIKIKLSKRESASGKWEEKSGWLIQQDCIGWNYSRSSEWVPMRRQGNFIMVGDRMLTHLDFLSDGTEDGPMFGLSDTDLWGLFASLGSTHVAAFQAIENTRHLTVSQLCSVVDMTRIECPESELWWVRVAILAVVKNLISNLNEQGGEIQAKKTKNYIESMKKNSKNTEIRDALIDLFNGIIEGKQDLREANVQARIAGQILKSAGNDLRYVERSDKSVKIEFFEN